METKQVATGLGIVWLRKGWTLFRKEPALWVLLTCMWVAVMGVLLIIPLIGATIMWILGPAIYAGFIFCASELDHSRELRAEHLFRGLMNSEKRMGFITLGCISFAIFLMSTTITRAAFVVPWIPEEAFYLVVIDFLLRALLFALLGLLMFITLTYSGPSIMFRGTEPFEALMNSAGACLKNWRPLLIFIGVSLGLMVLAALPFGLGFLVLIPVLFCALYYSYKDVYGMP